MNFGKFLHTPDLKITSQFSRHITKANIPPKIHAKSKAKNGLWFYVIVFHFYYNSTASYQTKEAAAGEVL